MNTLLRLTSENDEFIAVVVLLKLLWYKVVAVADNVVAKKTFIFLFLFLAFCFFFFA